jgi:hypothetical protein
MEVQRAIAASPEEVFVVVADPQGQVTIDSSGMLMSAEPGAITKVGDEFTIHMDREALNDIPALGLYDVTNVIIAFEADREIASPGAGGASAISTATVWSPSTQARWSPRTATGRGWRTSSSRGASRSSPRALCGPRSESSPAPSPRASPARRYRRAQGKRWR